jgi:hypothetical protein
MAGKKVKRKVAATDQGFRRNIAELLHAAARRIESGEGDPLEFTALPIADCPAGKRIWKFTVQMDHRDQ